MAERYGNIEANRLALTKKNLPSNASPGTIELVPDITGVLKAIDENGIITGIDNNIIKSEAATFTNKKYDGGIASDTNKTVLSSGTTASLDALVREEGSVYYDTDKQSIVYDNGTTVEQPGGSGLSRQLIFDAVYSGPFDILLQYLGDFRDYWSVLSNNVLSYQLGDISNPFYLNVEVGEDAQLIIEFETNLKHASNPGVFSVSLVDSTNTVVGQVYTDTQNSFGTVSMAGFDNNYQTKKAIARKFTVVPEVIKFTLSDTALDNCYINSATLKIYKLG